MNPVPVVDVFAGPGGLNEGFSRVVSKSGHPVFEVVASFEKDPTAVETLRLRTALRLLEEGSDFGPYRDLLGSRRGLPDVLRQPRMAGAYQHARAHVLQVELGPSSRAEVNDVIRNRVAGAEDWVLIGGPPCQAYSLVGRARRTHDLNFDDDEKHLLYREYLDIIQQNRPAVFVMENVKGLLSANHRGHGVFQMILNDLKLSGAYDVRSLVVPYDNCSPRDYIIRAEEYGVPQRRHRVILLGLRRDLADRKVKPLEPTGAVTVRDAIHGLPTAYSEITGSRDSVQDKLRAFNNGVNAGKAFRSARGRAPEELVQPDPGHARADLTRWYGDFPISLHLPRRHMVSDLERYAFLATVAEWGWFPRVDEFPGGLAPNHKNLEAAKIPFMDRFKVQAWGRPSSTVASHISKDGHYYIHPDATQMRSLTVREAARLQTFPDDYYFCGPRTMQFHQVGNAVPPLLAFKIAQRVAEVFDQF